MTCKNHGCNGRARRGQYFCYDCYTAWQQGGDDAVAKRIEEMRKGTQELEELRRTVERIKEFVLGPKEFMGAPVVRDYSNLALWERLGRDKQLLVKLRRAHRDAAGASPRGMDLAARNDRLWAWLENQLDKANKPKPVVLETLRFDVTPSYGKARCSDCGMPCYLTQRGCPKAKCGAQCWAMLGLPCVPVKVCNHPAPVKHPSAKIKDEAEPLRLKVAELEGKLLVAQQGIIPSIFIKALCTISLMAGLGFGFLLK